MTTTEKQAADPTYNDIIEAHLLSGRPITSWQAITEYRITCLAQRIYDLRNVGLPIQSIMIKENAKRFSRYWIDAADIENIQGAKR